ncbi:ABC transporter permease [Oceanobacillus bengalensis]|uniref:ABC transporter permease n=1 Tax=Oceanobacillus bengalensis TaxID=1435466 RepID=A0A494Z020_9BACI|nr:ABC transporter permease [Oceanobacillus bengalensis]RKQ15832.1 ABC transporter permease [Oceanobacillus bengalensis]
MFISMFGAVESGIIYAIMALGVYLTFRVLDFPDLTVEGSFVTGAAVTAFSIVNGIPPFVATVLAAVAGFIAGCLTGILHTKGKINALLAGILMMTALYSINLRVMGQPTLSMLNETTLFDQLESVWAPLGIDSLFNGMISFLGIEQIPRTWAILILMIFVTIGIKLLTDFYLKTEIGLALRAIGDNKKMIRSLSANTDSLIITGVGISNALVALAGGLIAQLGGFADVNMGLGLIVIGLASIIIGEALFGTKSIVRATLAVILGAVIYRMIVTLALEVDFLEAGDMKLITAVIVVVALVTPKVIQTRREKKRRIQKRAQLRAGGDGHA